MLDQCLARYGRRLLELAVKAGANVEPRDLYELKWPALGGGDG